MFSDTFQRGTLQFFRQIGHGPSTSRPRRHAWARLDSDFGALDQVGERAAVLRTLIEEFGGEAVGSRLHRRLVQLVSWKEAECDQWLREILDGLEHCGALTLEGTTGSDVIARIEPAGVSLAYDPPVLSQSTSNASGPFAPKG